MSDNYKNFALNFYWKTTAQNETFYFDTKQALKDFIKSSKNDILIERAFKMVDIDIFE